MQSPVNVGSEQTNRRDSMENQEKALFTAFFNDMMRQQERAREEAQDRVAKAKEKKAIAKYEPTWEEVWQTGYKTHTGATKKGIFQTKLSDTDRDRLEQVKAGIEQGLIGTGVDSLRLFTKSKAVGLYKVLKEVTREATIRKMVAECPKNYHCIRDKEELSKMLGLLESEDIIGLDTETTGLDAFGEDYIVGFSMTLPKADYHCYVPIRHRVPERQLEPLYVLESIKPYIESEVLRKVLHNAKFDSHMFYREGIDLNGIFMDTRVAMHLLNENEPSYSLKPLSTKYGKFFGFEDKSSTYEELFGKGGFQDTPLDIGTVYACKDTHLTYRLAMWIMEQFERVPQLKDLYFNIELPITNVCIDMERAGFNINLEFAEEYKVELTREVGKLQERIVEGFGDINVNSNQQLGEVIYKQWGVKDAYKGSVDAKTLKKIVDKHEKEIPQVSYIKDLLEYRDLNKLLSTYITPLPQKISPLDGRLHGSFNQADTVTGRFASNKPNLQNLPYRARYMFTAPEGKIIIGSDYSQIEPRFLAHISQDESFRQAYIDGRDLYSEIASRTFKKPIEECGDGSKWRKMAKVVLLGMMYGISSHSLADSFNLSQQEAEQIYIDFKKAYPTMDKWFKAVNQKANTEGFVQTAMGRKRRFLGHMEVAKKYNVLHARIVAITGEEDFNLWTDKRIPRQLKMDYWAVAKEWGRVQRQSINAVIQGSSADIMKKAMIDIWEHLKTKGSEWKMIATVHDEVLIEIPESATPEEIKEIADIQRKAVALSIPMKCDVAIMKTWGKDISLEEWTEAGCGLNGLTA